MLKTPQERAALLKAGVDLPTIEKSYLKHNNIRLVQKSVLFDAFSGKLPDDMCRASQFEGVHANVSYKKPEFILIIDDRIDSFYFKGDRTIVSINPG